MCGTCQSALAFHWFHMTEGALAQPLTAAQLTSCLEAVTLCTSADLALLEAQLAQPPRPAQLPDAGVIIAEPMSRVFGLSIQRKVWRSTAGPQREQLLAAALAAGEAVTRLVGRLVQEEEGQRLRRRWAACCGQQARQQRSHLMSYQARHGHCCVPRLPAWQCRPASWCWRCCAAARLDRRGSQTRFVLMPRLRSLGYCTCPSRWRA